MKTAALMVLLSLLAGCAYSPKYVGMPRDAFDTMRCPVTGKMCHGEGGVLTLNYKLERLDEVRYQLTGDAEIDLADAGQLKTEITMLFMGGDKVVHEERLIMYGREPVFSVEFESEREIKSASPWDFKGIIRS